MAMGWERRQGRQSYFYRSVRVNGRPCKLYVGRGPEAEREAGREADDRSRRLAEREARALEHLRISAADRLLSELKEMTGLLAAAVMLLAGLHCHHGSWRRRTT